jgi:hypothetical protein
MSHKAVAVVGWVMTVLDALALGIPTAILVVEEVQHGYFPTSGPWFEAVVYFSVASWLGLLATWLAVGRLNPRHATAAGYCLLLSLALMLLLMLRPQIQSGAAPAGRQAAGCAPELQACSTALHSRGPKGRKPR